jgi:hypothetical protein
MKVILLPERRLVMKSTKLARKLGSLLVLSLALVGCAGTPPFLEKAGAAYEQHDKIGFSSGSPEKWNATDWSLWMDMQGGG